MTMTELPGLANFRDVGGLPTDSGRRTRTGVLYRSDAPLPHDPAPAVAAWPPVLVLDLRSADEPVDPHPLAAVGSRVHRFPLLAEARPRDLAELRARGELSMTTLYAEMVRRAAAIIRPVTELLVGADGPALVHCAAGKDRTGVLVALLLRAASVTREAIIADYVRTTENMRGVRLRLPAPDRELAAFTAEYPDIMTAPAPVIGAVLDLVESGGGVQDWLADAGVHPALLARWTDRLVES